MLAPVRPRDIAGKTRRRIAADELAELIAVEAKIKKATAELKTIVLARGSSLMDIHGVGPVVAARILADVGDVARFADRNRFASWTGTAPLDASSGEQNRHRLSRAGNREPADEPHDPYRRSHSAARRHRRPDLLPTQASRGQEVPGGVALSRAESPTSSSDTSSLTPSAPLPQMVRRVREGTAGRLFNPARSTCPRTSTLRISHFPDPHVRR